MALTPWPCYLRSCSRLTPAGRSRRARPQRTPGFRPRLEPLEDRCVPATLTVNTTADSNLRDTVLTLREAILVANGTLAFGTLTASEQAQVSGTLNNPGTDSIAFNIGGGGVQTISPTSALPIITDAVVLDGTTQPGFAGTPLIELNGSG